MPMLDLSFASGASLFASGSRALAELLAWGVAAHGWTRVWLPSYYCPEVPAAVAAFVPGLALPAYPDSDLELAPPLSSVPVQPGDVIVAANQLGIRPRPAAHLADGVTLIEDHSHDLGSDWALGSRAHYAFASLRKTLPLPDGGAVWSPLGLALPPEPAPAEDRTAPTLAEALRRRADRAPSDGGDIPFRALARSAFARSSRLVPAAMSPVSRALLPGMPIAAWRDARRRNFELLANAVPLPDGVRVLLSPPGGVPFAYTVVFDDPAERERAIGVLAGQGVTPAVLWTLDPAVHAWVLQADADLSSRILSLHCDQRFSTADMRHIAAAVGDALSARQVRNSPAADHRAL